jgi:DNA-directed RNA polymerase II subunit RPB2
MSEQNLHWQKNIFNVIDNYFKTIPNYISRNQLDSYNIFLKNQIPKTIRQFNPLIHSYGKDTYINADRKETEYFTHKIEIIIGGSLQDDDTINNDGTGVYLTRPIIQENVSAPLDIQVDYTESLAKDTDGAIESKVSTNSVKKNVRIRQLYPNEARLKNLTYSTLIACDIFVKITNIEKVVDNTVEKLKEHVGIVKKFNKVPLGNIPIMIKSNLCVLSNTPKDILYHMGECIYDQGGYFIINGKEKVIISQERQVENRIYIHKNTTDPKIEYESDIRSAPENILQPARITRLLLTYDNVIYVKLPHCNAKQGQNIHNVNVPLILLFRALGIVTDKNIVELIVQNNQSNMSNSMITLLSESIVKVNENNAIYTQADALRELSTYVTAMGNPIRQQHMKKVHLQDILRNHFLPHVGKGYLEKAHFLAYMVHQLLLVKIGVKSVTDRDSFMNKRVDAAGYLIGIIFRDLYFRVKNNLRDTLNKAYYSIVDSESTEKVKDADKYWNSRLENNRTQLDMLIGDMESVSSTVTITDIFDKSIMTEGFMYAFKNCWGLKNARGCKQGIVQDLNRLSYLGFSSHLRRINTPLPSGAKVRAPHSLHSSSYGIMCPSETPDGGNIGVRKNLAIMSQITFGTSSDPLERLLFSLQLISIHDISEKNIHTFTKIFLNERLLGFHEYPKYLCDILRLYRRNALINVYTSISWYVMDNIVKISTTSGRCCRPLLIVNDNKCLLTDEHIQKIKNNTIHWKHLIGGFRTLDYVSKAEEEPYIDDNGLFTFFDKHKYKQTRSTDNTLRQNLELYQGVIEYIDTEEANNTLIALTPHDLEKTTLNKYTHCEIHPTMLFGIIANNIPLLERNQAPRNQFATVHGKQALGVYATNFKNRMDTKVQVMFYPQKPIVQSVYSKYLFTDKIPHGINAIVAVGCYTGYNQEDSLIFNKSSIERGLFRTVKFRTYSDMEDIQSSGKEREEIQYPNEKTTIGMKVGNYSKLDKTTGLIKENTHVTDSDIIVGKVQSTGEKDSDGNTIYMDKSLLVKRHEGGIIDKVHYNKGNDDQNYVKIRLRKDKIPEIGDKFCSRFGQKGTVGMVLDAENMPFTKKGIVPDIIMNPHALPSRMTLGQILEVILGKACVENGKISKLASFSNINEPLIGDVLEELGYERCANEVLYNGMTGKQMKVSIFMGPTYYQRLIHQVSDKMNARTSGPKASLSHQPVGGRAIGGGLRIGEMERDSLLAHGISYFIKESFMERADKYSFYISNKSGLLAIVNKDKHIFEDFSKDETKIKMNKEGNIEKFSNKCSSADFICIEAPYSFKLFLQEIESMGVALRMITSDIYEKWSEASKGQIQVLSTHRDVPVVNNPKLGYYQTVGSNITKPLRKYHNIIKEILLNNKTNNVCNISTINKSLLDTSVGRGGDIFKWYQFNYKHILALDIDKQGIESTKDDMGGEGARKRLDNMKGSKQKLSKNKRQRKRQLQEIKNKKEWAKNSKVFFGVVDTSKNIREIDNIDEEYHSELTQAYEYFPTNSFDVVSSQFTIHYYFQNKLNIEGYLQNVQQNIKKDGYLLVTCLDGESVYNLLKTEHTQTGNAIYEAYMEEPVTQKNKIWSIRSDNLDMSRDRLSNDTFNEMIQVFYQSIGNERPEYLVHKENLIRLAADYNLFLPSNVEIQSNFNTFTRATDTFGNVYAPIKNKYTFDQVQDLGKEKYKELKKYSDLHRYYVFKYIPTVTEEERQLYRDRSLEIVSNQVSVSTSDIIIKNTFLPSSFIETFTHKELKRIEKQYSCTIIIHPTQEKLVNDYQEKEEELRLIENSSVTISRTSKGKENALELAKNLSLQERFEESLDIYNTLIENIKIDSGLGDEKVLEIMYYQYKVYFDMEDYENAMTILKELIAIITQILTTSITISEQTKQTKQKELLVHQMTLAYCMFKLGNKEASEELFEKVTTQIHHVFSETDSELYSLSSVYAEYLYISTENTIAGYNKCMDIIQKITNFLPSSESKNKLLVKVFSIVHPEDTDGITLHDTEYTKLSIVSKQEQMEAICIDIKKYRDRVTKRKVSGTFAIIIPYYDEQNEVQEETPSLEIPERATAKMLQNIEFKQCIDNIKNNFKDELDANICSIYVVKQTRKKIPVREFLYTEDIFEFDPDDTEKEMGFLHFNKGVLINTGYELAKKDKRDFMVIVNPNNLYHSRLSSIIKLYPKQVHIIGQLEKAVRDVTKYELDIMTISLSDFKKINGCPNDVWDPFLVDKIVYNRIDTNDIVKLYPILPPNTSGEDNFSVLKKNPYRYSLDKRGTEDYIQLDSYAQHYSGLSQFSYSVIRSKEKLEKNILIVDVDVTLATLPLETYRFNDTTARFENTLQRAMPEIDITQPPITIISNVLTKLIESYIHTTLHTPTTNSNIITILLEEDLKKNMYKTLYMENRIQYIVNNIDFILLQLEQILGREHPFTANTQYYRVAYKYNQQKGFYVFVWKDFNYYTGGKDDIFDILYTQRNSIDKITNQYSTQQKDNIEDIKDTILQEISQGDKEVSFMEYVYNYIVYTVGTIVEIYRVQEDNSYEKQTMDEEGFYELTIEDKTVLYYSTYNLFYFTLQDELVTEYKNKTDQILFSEQMPKEYFNEEEQYDGQESGYYERDPEDIVEFNRYSRSLFKKSYRLGVIYNSASAFIVNTKDGLQSGLTTDSIQTRIDYFDKTLYCESNEKAKEERSKIKALYKKLVDIAKYTITNSPIGSVAETEETSTEETPTEETPTEETGIDSTKKGEQKGGSMDSSESSHFSMSNMVYLQKGGSIKKSDLFNIKKKIVYLFKGLPMKFIKKIQLDLEALYSITKYSYANKISKFIMKLPGIDHTSTILECMSCVGGNSISFLEYFSNSIFVEKDPDKTSMLINNVQNYKEYSKKQLGDYSIINNDILKVIQNKEHEFIRNGCDVVFVDPPWGGTNYKHSKKLKIKIGQYSLAEFVALFRNITRYVVFKLPFNYDMKHLHKSLQVPSAKENIGSIINVQDIKNTKNAVKMKIVFIELLPEQETTFTPEEQELDINIGHSLVEDRDVTKKKYKNEITSPHQDTQLNDDIESGFLNIENSKASLDMVPSTAKIIKVQGYSKPSILEGPMDSMSHTVSDDISQNNNDTDATMLEQINDHMSEHIDNLLENPIVSSNINDTNSDTAQNITLIIKKI